MLRIWRLGVSAGVLVLLAGCQSFIGAFSAEDNLEAARNAGPPAGAFGAALQQEYIAIAQIELDEYDFEHADTFALKAIAAANGEDVQPEDPGDWTLSRDLAGQFYAARGQLLLALDNNGRTAAPGDAAQAQAMFDCWIQEQELANEGHQPEDIAACREAFEAALARVQEAIAEPEPMAEAPPPAPEPPARDYLVYFDFDKTDIRTDAASILDRVAEAVVELGSGEVSLTGFTDTAGTGSIQPDTLAPTGRFRACLSRGPGLDRHHVDRRQGRARPSRADTGRRRGAGKPACGGPDQLTERTWARGPAAPQRRAPLGLSWHVRSLPLEMSDI